MDDKKRTLVEEGTELKGTLRSSCPVVVNGSIDGQIESPALTVTRSGSVQGSVQAKELRSDGVLAGNIDADNVYLSGTVRDNTVIRARTLEVKLAQQKGKLEVTFGECLLDVGDEPAVAQKSNGEVRPMDALGAAGEPMMAQSAPEHVAQSDGARTADHSEEPTWSAPPPAAESEEEQPKRRSKRPSNRTSQPPM